MASNSFQIGAILTVLSASLLLSFPSPTVADTLTYHGGPLLSGRISLTFIFYGQFEPPHKAIVRAFVSSLNFHGGAKLSPQVSHWWQFLGTFHDVANQTHHPGRVKIVKQVEDPSYSLGHVLTVDFLKPMIEAADGVDPNSILVVFAAKDVTVQGLCLGKCAVHGVLGQQPYIIVGNPELECPDSCAAPFYKAEGASGGTTVNPPNGNLAGDAMAIALAQGLVEVVTNPYETGFYQDLSLKGIEAATACQGIFGSGADDTNAGKILLDPATRKGFNAYGSRGRKFLLPAIWNPKTDSCWTVM